MIAKMPLKTLRPLVAALALCALAGCGSDSGSGWSQLMDLAKASFNQSGNITLQQAASVPYASIGVRVGDGPESMLALAADTGTSQLWTSSAHIAIAMKDGRIIETAGLPKNLSATVFAGLHDPLPALLRAPNPRAVRSARAVDFQDIAKYSVPLRCSLGGGEAARISILGHAIATRRFKERCESSDLDWSFTNLFWADRSGFVWRSLQYIHPGSDPVEVEVLRPPS